jgi:hypothetical protein
MVISSPPVSSIHLPILVLSLSLLHLTLSFFSLPGETESAARHEVRRRGGGHEDDAAGNGD